VIVKMSRHPNFMKLYNNLLNNITLIQIEKNEIPYSPSIGNFYRLMILKRLLYDCHTNEKILLQIEKDEIPYLLSMKIFYRVMIFMLRLFRHKMFSVITYFQQNHFSKKKKKKFLKKKNWRLVRKKKSPITKNHW
jgi:hypothetical protein